MFHNVYRCLNSGYVHTSLLGYRSREEAKAGRKAWMSGSHMFQPIGTLKLKAVA